MIPAEHLEVAVLDRNRAQPRKFLRLMGPRLVGLLGERGPETPDEVEPEGGYATPAPPVSPADEPGAS